MKTPLAWLNLRHDKTRTVVAVAGVAFAVVLVLMQLGFLHSAERTATQVYDQLDFDVLIVSKQYLYLSKPGTFPRLRLFQAREVEGVESAEPLYVGFNLWLNAKRNAETSEPKHAEPKERPVRRGIFVIGLRLTDAVFRSDEVRNQLPRLSEPGNVLMDTFSRKQFGTDWEHNDELEIGGRRIHVAGRFAMGTGFAADADVIVSDATFRRIFPGRSAEDVSLGLVKMAPGAEANEVAERLRRMWPEKESDVRVFTRAEIADTERRHWVTKTSVGVIFKLGVVVGFIVGTAIVYQVLSSDIANHMPEYATLKAMGYGPGYLAGVVLQQAWILALVGFVPGWFLSRLLYSVTSGSTKIPMDLSWELTWSVLFLTIAMCSVSGLAALRKVNAADPADLF
ncbi:MAG TPA: ABC transporter permease DevC [Pirellulales bacterium]|jgi:putative ABC transport system permease protein|nr:ABC transporter permease DevC [Pirellulales bacterium]